MARLYPEALQSIAMNNANTAGQESGINTPVPPDFNTPAMEGSLQQFLADNLGEYVVVEFLIGTQTLVQKAGVLYAVGTSVMTLYQELSQTFITCDLFSIKFVTFYLPGHRPWHVNNPMFNQGDIGAIPNQGGCMGGNCGGFQTTLGG